MPSPQIVVIAALRVRTRPVANGQKRHLINVKIADAMKNFVESFRVQAGATIHMSYPQPVQATLPLVVQDGGSVLGVDISPSKEDDLMRTIYGEPPPKDS